jgi:hypothetical protein
MFYMNTFIFLDKVSAIIQYQNTNYFSKMNYVELVYRLDSLGAMSTKYDVSTQRLQSAYIDNVVSEFTNDEKAIIAWYIKYMLAKLQKTPNLLPNKQQIGLIKIKSGVDWNNPYTINHCIVFPELFVKRLVETYNEFKKQYNGTSSFGQLPIVLRPLYDMVDDQIVTICHELIHILQRYPDLYPQHAILFDKIYVKLWGFTPISKDQIEWLHPNEQHYFNVITNPDGYNYQWAIQIEKKYYLPLLSRTINNALVGILCEIVKTNGKWKITGKWENINDVSEYVLKFYGLNKQLYHPNEIFSHLVSNYLIKNQIFVNHSTDVGYMTFYSMINRHFVTKNYIPFNDR